VGVATDIRLSVDTSHVGGNLLNSILPETGVHITT